MSYITLNTIVRGAALLLLTSILTATIASYFVERRLMEGKGMEKITWRGHTVICGWNVNGRDLLDGIYRETRDSAQVVIVNNLPEEEVSELRAELDSIKGSLGL